LQPHRELRPLVDGIDDRGAEQQRSCRPEGAPVEMRTSPRHCRGDQCRNRDDCKAERDDDAQDAEPAGAVALRAIPGVRDEDITAITDDFVAGEVDHHARLASLAYGNARITVSETPVDARRSGVLLDLDLAQRRWIEREALRNGPARQRASILLGQAAAGLPP